MTIEYDPKFYIDSLIAANARGIERMDKIEEAFDLLYDAVLEIAEVTNTLEGKVFAKLEEAHRVLHRRPDIFRLCGQVRNDDNTKPQEEDKTIPPSESQ